ncbi:hypothetical protein BaRGS_00000434, partial [Batillaria attramentaria]
RAASAQGKHSVKANARKHTHEVSKRYNIEQQRKWQLSSERALATRTTRSERKNTMEATLTFRDGVSSAV